MIDNNTEVNTVLSAVGNTEFQYPKTFATFPIISYWDSGHEASEFVDGFSTLDIVETTVDVWEKEDVNGNLVKIHEQMDSAMRAAKFVRAFPMVTLYETDTHVFHYQGKYKKIYEEVD